MLEQQRAYPIYRASEHDMADVVRALLPGDTVLMTTLGRAASNRRDLQRVIDDIHTKKSFIAEASTGRSTKDGAETAQMVLDAVKELTGDVFRLTPRQAKEYGRKGGELNGKRLAEGRMPERYAKTIWRDPANADLKNEEVLAKLEGWTVRAAYRHLGKRGLAKGRPRVKR